MEKIIDSHYFLLPTQGNIYSLAVMNLCSGLNKLIVASLKKKIFSFEYFESSAGVLKPTVKEISCTYIPSGAEIISVDAFNKSKTCDDFQIGIAIAKPNAEGSPETYLNIYSEQEPENNYVFNIDNIAQNCLMVELNFIPYHLTHALSFHQSSEGSDLEEIVWLLSGSDVKIHLYKEDQQNHSYTEADLAELFPELTIVPSIVLWLDIRYTLNLTKRLSVMGCECGIVQLHVVQAKSNTLLSTHTHTFDGPISQVMFFSLFPKDLQMPNYFCREGELEEDLKENSTPNTSKNDLHLLVCNTLDPSVVFMGVEEAGFSDMQSLIGSEVYDACLCACAGDINMDGCNEILLGTYGQKVLMYKLNGSRWDLCGQRGTANPVHAIKYVDLIGDGVNELVVQTLSGVHILQHDPEHVQQIFVSRLKKILGKEEKTESTEPVTIENLPEEEECPCEEAFEKSKE